jgi:hypothetical protein
MPAITHPGSVIHVWDHLVITLRDAATGANGAHGAETGFLSLYAIGYSPSLGAGHVALVEVPGIRTAGLAATFTDDVDLGRRQQDRLRAMGERRAAIRDAPVEARFERIPYGPDGFGFRITSTDRSVEARWEAPDPPFWVDGQNGGFHDSEDIWAMMVGTSHARLIVDGQEIAGVPFDDNVWIPKLGRSLSSAHGAFSEVRVTPVSGRATGSGPDGPR